MAIPRFEDTEPLFEETTPLESSAEAIPKESKLDKAASFIRKVGKKLSPITEPIGMAFEQAEKQLPLPSQAGLMAQRAVQDVFSKGGESVAETLAGPGLTAKTFAGLPIPSPAEPGQPSLKTSPEVAAAIGTGIQMTPDIAALVAGMGGAHKLAQTGELGQAGRVVSGIGRKEAGTAMEAAEKAIEINTEIIPTLKKVGTELGLKSNETTAKTVINKINELRKAGVKMTPQQLSDQHKLLTDLLRDEPTGFRKLISPRPSKLGTSGVAQASRLDKKIVQDLNEVAKGRGEGAAQYSAAKTRENIYKGVGGLVALTGAGSQIKDMIIRSLRAAQP